MYRLSLKQNSGSRNSSCFREKIVRQVTWEGEPASYLHPSTLFKCSSKHANFHFNNDNKQNHTHKQKNHQLLKKNHQKYFGIYNQGIYTESKIMTNKVSRQSIILSALFSQQNHLGRKSEYCKGCLLL